MLNLICLDRDGTINQDENYYLGSHPNWKSQVKFLDGVVEGIKKINSIKNTHVFIVTNQSGVALTGGNFNNLTEERMREVNEFIIEELKNKGSVIRGYFACPFVTSDYAKESEKKGKIVNPEYIVDNHPDQKPSIGMIKSCAESLGVELAQIKIFVIGDRASDVELGINGGGHGILIASQKTKELGDVAKVQTLATKHPSKVFIANNFLGAVEYIEKNLK